MTSRAADSGPIGPLCDRAKALHQSGRLAEAAELYQTVLARDPRHFEALHLTGLLHLQSGRPELAVGWLRRAIEANASVAVSHSLLGDALQASNRSAEAVMCYERAFALQPDAPTAYNRAVLLAALGRRREAIESYDRAIGLDRRLAQAWYNRGVLLHEEGDRAAALASYDKAISVNSRLAEPHSRRGLVLGELGRPLDALASYEAALSLNPRDPNAHNGRGAILAGLGRHVEALEAFERAIAIDPSFAEAHGNRGGSLRRVGRLNEALRSYDTALDLAPGLAVAHHGRAATLADSGRHEEALAACDRALALQPDMWEAWQNRAHINLTLGRFTPGWREYEWRKAGWPESLRRDFGTEAWGRGADFGDGTLFVHFEQGLGDTIQFARYAALLAGRPGPTVLMAPASLKTLLQASLPAIEVIAEGEPAPKADVVCALMSLPLAFGTNIATIPAPEGYLTAAPDRVASFTARLGPRRRPRIGLAWSGNPTHGNDHNRSLPFATLSPILAEGAEWIRLQDRIRPTDAEAVSQFGRLVDLSPELRDFGATAALVQALDLVIAVDTSVAHLAGALGKPVWILLPHNPDWRWLLHRRDSPWYASARLFRQGAPGDWGGVLQEVRRELEGLLAR